MSAIDVNGTLRSINAVNPTSGVGLEMEYYVSGSYGQIYAYDRDALIYKDMILGATGNQLFLKANGNVGIGTNNPVATIQAASTNINYPAAYFYNYAAIGSSRGLIVEGGSNASDYSSDFRDKTGASLLFIRGDGNVSIGTDAPISLFQVDDGCTKAAIGDASGTGLNYGTSYLGFNASRSGTNWSTNSDGGNNGGGTIYSSVFGDMYFSIIRSTVNASGQTLTDAQVKNNIALRIDHINGAVYAKQVYVQTTGWPDYVFKNDYALMPLSEVKTYIDQNQHLPEIPSEQEVADKGINLGEMNKLLTKKVEELTLYLIDLKTEKDKKEKEQQTQIEKQETQLNNQQSQIDLLKTQLQKIADSLSKEK